jgi:hypothetical protein
MGFEQLPQQHRTASQPCIQSTDIPSIPLNVKKYSMCRHSDI